MTDGATMAQNLNLVHRLELDVNIFDTDCFGVMWHGAYTKWMEMGRVKLFAERGLLITNPKESSQSAEGYIYPVAEQHFKFKSPAAFGDQLSLTTRLMIEGYKLIFHQDFLSHQHNRNTLEAVTTVVVVDAHWKLQRRLPPSILSILMPPEV